MQQSNTHNKIKIGLIGNPNSGKSSLFNGLTGLRQKTGNYSGVTVDRYEGNFNFKYEQLDFTVSVLDLPGMYSLYPKSTDEQIACKALLDDKEQIDVAVLVLDSTNLKRNLLLATQVIDLKYKTVVVLNMIDEAEKQNIVVDITGLSKTLGVEIIAVDSRKQRGFKELKQAIVRARVSESFFYDINNKFFENTSYVAHSGSYAKNEEGEIVENADKIYRYNVINYMMAKFVSTPEHLSKKETTSKIDKLVTHKILGYVLLLFILFLVFQFIFYVSESPMGWIEQGFLSLGEFLREHLPQGELSDLLVNGIVAGISGIVIFIPQIALLFLFIGLLEDSGYMARAGFIMDRIMRPFGLNGRSVIPLISSAACAVPSIMATRSISNFKERLITIFIAPLISCSARLPVYTLLISVLYPNTSFLGIFNTKGIVLLLLYILGFTAALITAFLLKNFIKTNEASFFIMELPVYRSPQLKNIGIMVYNKVKVFVMEAGKIILAISVILWFLSSHGYGEKYNSLAEKSSELQKLNQNDSLAAQIKSVEAEMLENSYIGKVGHVIEPLIKPLGFDWKIGIALITSFAAREVFVGTMATIYQSAESDNEESIREKLVNERDTAGNHKYTGAVCWSLLLFYAFALQCMSTIAVVKRETKSWKWVLAQLIFMSLLAYSSAFLSFQLLS